MKTKHYPHLQHYIQYGKMDFDWESSEHMESGTKGHFKPSHFSVAYYLWNHESIGGLNKFSENSCSPYKALGHQ